MLPNRATDFPDHLNDTLPVAPVKVKGTVMIWVSVALVGIRLEASMVDGSINSTRPSPSDLKQFSVEQLVGHSNDIFSSQEGVLIHIEADSGQLRARDAELSDVPHEKDSNDRAEERGTGFHVQTIALIVVSHVVSSLQSVGVVVTGIRPLRDVFVV